MSNDDITTKLNYAIHPGEILQDTLEEYHLTQKELASRIGVTPKHVNEIIQGKASITSTIAQKLEFVFNTSPSFWLNLQKNYEEINARLAIEEQFKKEKELLGQFVCYRDLSKFKYVKETRDSREKYTELLSFFGISSLSLLQSNYSVQFRKTDKAPNPLCMAAWLRMGEIHFYRNGFTKPFNEQVFKQKLLEMRSLTTEPIESASRKLVQACYDSGVLIAFTPYLKQTYVNGATRWLSPQVPLIQMTVRTARSDAFWFTLFHEAAHILKHGKKNSYVEWESNHSTDPDEVEANEFAANMLIPQSEYRQFVAQNDFSQNAIKSFSGKVGIGQDIVAGRLANDKHITWPYAQRFIKRIMVTND